MLYNEFIAIIQYGCANIRVLGNLGVIVRYMRPGIVNQHKANMYLAAPPATPFCNILAAITPITTIDHTPWKAWRPRLAFAMSPVLTILRVVCPRPDT